MKRFNLVLFAIILVAGLTSCDIKPISVGTWQTQVELPHDLIELVWMINADESLVISGDWDYSLDTIELDGSRIAFSSQLPLAVNGLIDVNFSGTVSGNSIQGTFFTTEGNFTLSGERQN